MEQWEKDQERIIKREHELRNCGYVPISEEQQRKNMERNWMEITDENGNKHYEPLIDNHLYIDLSRSGSSSVPKAKKPAKSKKKKSSGNKLLILVFILLYLNLILAIFNKLLFW